MPDTKSLALAIRAAEEQAAADPLKDFEWASKHHRAVAEAFCQRTEVAHRAGNKGGKTYNGAALIVALARMERSLCGIPLPAFSKPLRIAVLVPSYKQAIDSSNKTIFDLLGDWPHECGWVQKSLMYLGSILVKPRNWHSNSSETWSRIMFISQDANDPASVKGQRWDVGWGDEPPKEPYWREIRKNTRFRLITFTPLDIGEWEWIQKDFDGCLGHKKGNRIEWTSSVYNNRFLPKDEITQLELDYANDPFKEARLYGHYVDVSGMTPWGDAGYKRVQELRAGCLEPELVSISLPDMIVPVTIQTWGKPEPGNHYILTADLAEGLDDGKGMHDPLEFGVFCRETACHHVRYSGYDDPFYVGLLSAHVAEGWNDSHVDYDSTAGYGRAYNRGLLAYRSRQHPSGYKQVLREGDPEKWGLLRSQVGYKVTPGLRAESISAVKEWLTAKPERAERMLRTASRETLDSLMRIRLVRTASGTFKIQSRGRDHDEALFILGRFLVLNRDLPMPMQRDKAAGARDRIKALFGRDVLGELERKARWGQRAPIDNFGA